MQRIAWVIAAIMLGTPALSADGLRCIERPYVAPSLDAYTTELNARFRGKAAPAETPLSESEDGDTIWTSFVKDALSTYHERDVYCIADTGVTFEQLASIADTGGGNLYVLFASGDDNSSLPTPPADTLPGLAGRTVVDAISERFVSPLANCSNVRPLEPGAKMPDVGWVGLCERHNYGIRLRNSAVEALRKSYVAPKNGRRHSIIVDPTRSGAALTEFLSIVQSRDALLDTLYRKQSIVVGNGKRRKSDHTATSWLIAKMLSTMPQATLEAAAEIMDRAAEADLSTLYTLVLPERIVRNATLPLERTGSASWLERETVALLCNPIEFEKLQALLPDSVAPRIVRARNVLCAVRTEEGILTFYEDTGPNSYLKSQRDYLKLREAESGIDELVRTITNLRGDINFQHETVVTLTRLVGEREFRSRIASLEQAERRAVEAAKEAGLLEIGTAVVDTVVAVKTGVGATEAIDNVFDGLSGAGDLTDQFDYLWDNRKTLSKQADKVGEQIDAISSASEVIQGRDPSQLEVIRAALKEAREARTAFFQDMNETRDQIMAERAEIEERVLELTAGLSQRTLPQIADQTVSTNLFAYARPPSPTGSDRLRSCARLFRRAASGEGMPDYAELSLACYSHGAVYAERRDCAIDAVPTSGIVTVKLGSFSAYVTRGGQGHCLEIN